MVNLPVTRITRIPAMCYRANQQAIFDPLVHLYTSTHSQEVPCRWSSVVYGRCSTRAVRNIEFRSEHFIFVITLVSGISF
jgi:hypothetical protein